MQRDWWQKGKAFDLWSIPHFLFGMLMAFLPYVTTVSLISSFALMLLFAVLWELYEKFIHINETLTNNLFDVLLPVISFVFLSMFLEKSEISRTTIWVLFGATLLIYVFTNISGWLAFRRRQKEFMN